MPHYVCTGGCEGVSDDSAAVCQAEGCQKFSQPLSKCDCADNQHSEVFEKEQTEEAAEPEA